MRRYKFVWPKGHYLVECELSEESGPYMASKSDDGYWTEYEAAMEHADDAFERGLDQGRKEGQVKVDAIKDMNQAELTAEYNRGYNDGFMVWSTTGRPVQTSDDILKPDAGEDVSVLDTRTNQLLNELYHDRARLERVVADACDIIGGSIGQYEDVLLLTDWMKHQQVDGNLKMGPVARRVADTAVGDIGVAQQFVDTHGE